VSILPPDAQMEPQDGEVYFGTRNKIHIVDLQKTVKELKKAYKYVRDSVIEGKTVLFVGTKKQAQAPLKERSSALRRFFVCDRWLGGTMTNFETMKKSIARLNELNKMKEDGFLRYFLKGSFA